MCVLESALNDDARYTSDYKGPNIYPDFQPQPTYLPKYSYGRHASESEVYRSPFSSISLLLSRLGENLILAKLPDATYLARQFF